MSVRMRVRTRLTDGQTLCPNTPPFFYIIPRMHKSWPVAYAQHGPLLPLTLPTARRVFATDLDNAEKRKTTRTE